MEPALKRRLVEADLPKELRNRLYMLQFTTVGATDESQLPWRDPEMAHGATGHQRQRLNRLGRRAQVGHEVGISEVEELPPVRIRDDEHRAMARFHKRASHDFDDHRRRIHRQKGTKPIRRRQGESKHPPTWARISRRERLRADEGIRYLPALE